MCDKGGNFMILSIAAGIEVYSLKASLFLEFASHRIPCHSNCKT